MSDLLSLAVLSIAALAQLGYALYYTQRFLRAIPAWIKRNEL